MYDITEGDALITGKLISFLRRRHHVTRCLSLYLFFWKARQRGLACTMFSRGMRAGRKTECVEFCDFYFCCAFIFGQWKNSNFLACPEPLTRNDILSLRTSPHDVIYHPPISRFCALSTWHWIGCLHWVVTRLPLICFAKWRPLALVVGIMCVAVAVYSTKNRHVQNPWEMFQKVVRQHGLRGSSEVEKRILERKAISSLRKGMCTIFTRFGRWRISMSRHVAIDLSGKVQSLTF